MPGDPDKYLEKHQDQLSKEEFEALKEFKKNSDIADSTTYDYLSRLKNIFLTCKPEDFDIQNPSKEGVNELVSNIEEEKKNASTRRTWLKSVKKFYKVYQDGDRYGMVANQFTLGSRSAKVENKMILSPKEVADIVNQASNPRDKAYIRLLYETATTPGELLDAELQDVDLEQETIYVRGNKQHKSQTMELHNEGLHYLREYLKQHPEVDDIFTTTSDKPLWVKLESYKCSKCGEREHKHGDEADGDACDSFEPDELEQIGYRAMNVMFKRCVEQAGIDRDIKQKYLRKSMLTRIAPDVGYEQLNNFARWVPGSSQAQHYVSLSNDKLRSMVRERFKGEEGDQKEMIECKNCGSRNDPERLECKKCHRPLNVAKSQKMERAEEIADKLSEFDSDKLDMIEENMELLENPQEFIKKKMKEIQEGKD